MKELLLRNKKGVSLMIGYVLLIAIVIALSTGVFFYLKLYLPSEKPNCPDGIDLVVEELTCKSNYVLINISNRGLFSVDSAFIKIGEAGRIVKTALKDPSNLNLNQDRWTEGSSKCERGNNLKPGEKFCGEYEYSYTLGTVKEISVEPLLWIEDKPVICSGDVVKVNVVCS